VVSGISVSVQNGEVWAWFVPALKKWMSFRLGTMDGEDGKAESVQMIVAPSNSSIKDIRMVGVREEGRRACRQESRL
jgi:hypothetical protein